MKHRFFIFAVIILFAVVSLFIWRAYYWDSLPQIKDAELLRKDCLRLCNEFPLPVLDTNQMFFKELNDTNKPKFVRGLLKQEHCKKIPKESWPNSIVQLHPFDVYRDEFAVCICLIQNAHPTGPSADLKVAAHNWVVKGYYVHTNPNEAPPRSATHGFAEYFLYETEYDGIDEFRVPAAVL
jgi:hypothetical protein